jgi:D-ribose pyranose/furanose isomerase RbsD
MKFMQGLFDTDVTIKEKKVIYSVVKRVISDMESDGVYFSEDIKEKLSEYRDELNCEYSGLPSVKSYDK